MKYTHFLPGRADKGVPWGAEGGSGGHSSSELGASGGGGGGGVCL